MHSSPQWGIYRCKPRQVWPPLSSCALVALINEFAEPTQLRPSCSSQQPDSWTRTSTDTRISIQVFLLTAHLQCSCKTSPLDAAVLLIQGCHLAMLLTGPSHRVSVWPWYCTKLQYNYYLLYVLPALLTMQSEHSAAQGGGFLHPKLVSLWVKGTTRTRQDPREFKEGDTDSSALLCS